MSKLNEYKAAKIDFNSYAENMFNKTADRDDNVYIKRFKNFIDSNIVISKKILSGILDNEEPLTIREFFVPANPVNSFWLVIKPPVDEKKHIATMYELLNLICNDDENLKSISSLGVRVISQGRTTKVDESIQNFLKQIFSPLVDFINRSLDKEIVIMEQEKREGITFYQTIHGDNNGVVNISKGQTSINQTVLQESKEDIMNLIDKSIQDLRQETINEEVKEDIIDNLEIVKEESQKKQQKPRRITRAIESINSFIDKADESVIKSASLIGNLTLLATKLSLLLS